MLFAPPQKKSRSLAQQVMNAIAERIRSCEFRPGAKLPPESEICKAHGVSRTVVREAISRLQASGMVETRQGIGTFVLDTPSETGLRIDPATIIVWRDVLSILEFRIGVETEAAGLAAARRTDEQLSEMRRALDAFDEGAKRSSDTAMLDFKFHLLLMQASGNRYYIDVMTHLGTTIIPRTRINTVRLAQLDQIDYLKRISREHEDIYTAIARRDAEAARAAIRTHLSNSRERLRCAHEAAEKASG